MDRSDSDAMAAALRRARGALFTVADALAVQKWLRASEWRRRRLMIACYHGVSIDDEHEWNPGLYVSQETLRRRCAHLRDAGYAVLPLGTAIRRLFDGTLPSAAVALTFDDGLHDFHARALPVLREFGYPATVYVSTFYATFQRPVFDLACAYVAWKGRGAIVVPGTGLVADGAPLRVATAAERAASIARIRATCRARALDAAAKDDVARELARRLGVDYDAILARRLLHMMSGAEIAASMAAGVDVQLHTHRHRSPAEPALFAREISDNRAVLRDVAGEPAPRVHFCYPDGASSPGLLPLLREARIVSATTCTPGLAGPADHPLILPRYVDADSHPLETFDAWASGLAHALTFRRRAAAPIVADVRPAASAAPAVTRGRDREVEVSLEPER